MEEIKKIMERLNAIDYQESISWKGERIFVPIYEGNPKVGIPIVVGLKDNLVRVITGQESIDYLNYESEEKVKKKI